MQQVVEKGYALGDQKTREIFFFSNFFSYIFFIIFTKTTDLKKKIKIVLKSPLHAEK